MPPKIEMTGLRFGRVVVLEEHGRIDGHVAWKVRCDCGKEFITSGRNLRNGDTTSCGCYCREINAKRLTKHGSYGTRLYWIWKSMRERCNNPNDDFYDDYGERGITVCKEWDDFRTFEKWSFENGYDSTAEFGKCTIDRIDNNKERRIQR